MPDDQIHLVGAGPKRCCSCKNDRPCNCGCVCEDMTNLDDSGNTPTTKKQPNPSEDCYKAMQFNNYNYSDDPGQPTCQDPYEEPFIGPKAPCWMFVAKDCGDHQKCTQEEALTVCDSPTESIECDGEVIPVLKCYECPCTCETVSKLSGMAEGIFFNSKESCEEWRVDDDPGTQDCDKCVEVDFPQGENGSLCDDLRSNYINCAGNSACIGQQASEKCWTIVDKTCSDLGSGCSDGGDDPQGAKCEPSNSESDCPALQNCYSSCPNGTFTSEDACGEWRDSNDDDSCYVCEECASDDLANCWCVRPLSCEENGYYSGEDACDGDRVSFGCEGGGGIACATCMENDQCSEETDVDCWELVNESCDSIGGSFSNKEDCEDDLNSNESDRCYKCYQITDCDDCWSSNGRTEECWGVRPMNCSEIGGMSEEECELAIEASDEDAACLKCVDQECPETEDCFKVEAKTCAEMCRYDPETEDEKCCQEFCDEGQCMKECSIITPVGRCPDCVECRDCYCPCVTNARIVAKININVSGSGARPSSSVPDRLPFTYSFSVNMNETVDMEYLDYAGSACPPAPPPTIARCGSVYSGTKSGVVPSQLDARIKYPYGPGVPCPAPPSYCPNVTAQDVYCTGSAEGRSNTGCAPGNHVCLGGIVYSTSTSNPDNGYCDPEDYGHYEQSYCNYCWGWDPPECDGSDADCDDHDYEYACREDTPLTENCWPLNLSWTVDFCPDTLKLMRVSGGYDGNGGNANFSFDSNPSGASNTVALGWAYALNDYITVDQIPLYFTYNGWPGENFYGTNTPTSFSASGSVQIDFRFLSVPQHPVYGCDGNPVTDA